MEINMDAFLTEPSPRRDPFFQHSLQRAPLAVLDLTANDKLYTGTRHLCPYHHLLTVVIVADNVVIIIGILSTAGLKM